MYCEQCGKRIAETAKFCPYCGNAVGIADSVQSQQSVKREISTPPSLETKQGAIPASLETRQESTPASQEAKQEQKYVGFWARFAANFLDGILISILLSPSIFLAATSIRPEGLIVAIAAFWGLDILAVVILLVLWYKKQASIGKMAISAKIVDARTGKAPTKNQLIGRYFAYLLSFLPLGLGFLWIAFDSKKQGWHDKLAGTAVIYV
ncbi:RDD family protein [Fibrobacter sp.]|uniref:RDD family protein n=1 Tax=Fibrobacter sp. TaxID=35828 RepID=UPI00388FD10F